MTIPTASRNKREGIFQGFLPGSIAVRGSFPIQQYEPYAVNRKQAKKYAMNVRNFELAHFQEIKFGDMIDKEITGTVDFIELSQEDYDINDAQGEGNENYF